MAESKQRKKQIAQALVDLTSEQDFQKISVQEIALKAGINRQTFYYHFSDKNQLLRYIYAEDALRYLTSDKLSLDNWEEQALQMLKAMVAKGTFYQKTVAFKPEVLVQEFSVIITELFERLFDDVDQESLLTAEDKAFYGRFFAYGCSGVLLAWINGGYQETPLTIATQLFRMAKDVEFFSERLGKMED